MIAPMVLLATLATAPAKMIFHGSTSWVLTDASGRELSRFSKLGEYTPINVALSPDGSTLAFTATLSTDRYPQLYLWDGKAARRLSPDNGYHAAPSFSPTGRELAYVHHPGLNSGPLGKHAPGANAQLWTIAIDGSNPRQLTYSSGCKGSPHYAAKNLILIDHSDCAGGQGIENIRPLPAKTQPILDFTSLAGEPRQSPDGRRLAYLKKQYADTTLWVTEGSSPQMPIQIAAVPGNQAGIDIQWAADSQSLYFVSQDAIRRYSIVSRTTVPVASLRSSESE